MQIPQAVILDPAMTLTTSLELLRSAGMKALDHAAARLTSANANAYINAVFELALGMLNEGLLRLEAEAQDLSVRSKPQFGMFMSLRGAAAGVAVNVNHALGHVLGAHANVPHGHTTGVLLPSVLRWNRAESKSAQQCIAAALGREGGEAAVAVRDLVERLQVPTRLREVGVKREDSAEVARKTIHEALRRNSPRPVNGPSDIEEILELAWEAASTSPLRSIH